MKGVTYARLKAYAKEQGIAMSALVESWVIEDLDAKGVPVPERLTLKREPKQKRDRPPDIPPANFTF